MIENMVIELNEGQGRREEKGRGGGHDDNNDGIGKDGRKKREDTVRKNRNWPLPYDKTKVVTT